MSDFDELYDWGVAGEYVNNVVEIPKGSTMKIEYSRKNKTFEVDRVEPAIFAKPTNYGFIPQTLDEDGDALDTLLVTEEPLPTGVVLKTRVIGYMDFEDDGENDHKIVVVPEDDRQTGDAIKSLDDLPEQWKNQVAHHFNHYKDLKKPGSTKVRGWGNADAAWKVIAECVERFKK